MIVTPNLLYRHGTVWCMIWRMLCRTALAGVLSVCMFGLVACKTDQQVPGVVATVNGRPLTLRLLEARHDADGAAIAVAQSPSVELLQQQYGGILADLIVQELVAQELEHLGLAVTPDDVIRAEAEVRADYPGRSFEDMLFEDNIDITAWRALLRYRVAMDRFGEQVLRPKLSIPLPDVESYYAQHAAEFLVPARDVVVVITAPTRELAEKAGAQVLAGSSLQDMPDVKVQHVALRPAQEPEIWKDELGRLPLGKLSKVKTVGEDVQLVLLRERQPARRMSAVEAYPHIERVLVERRMESLFADWLSTAITGVAVQVAPQLIARQEAEAGSGAVPNAAPSPVSSSVQGNGGAASLADPAQTPGTGSPVREESDAD